VLKLFVLGFAAIALALIVPPIVNAEPSAKIIQHTGYIDPSGIYHVVGEVQNTGDEPLGFVTILVEFYDQNGDVIATDKVFTRIHVLLPGQLAPFDATALGRVTEDIHDYKLSAVAQVVKAKAQVLRLQSNMSYVDNLGLYHVIGSVVNDGDKYATYTDVVATFYDEEGRIVTTGRDLTEPLNIASGEAGIFKITIHRDIAGKIAKYSIDAESNEFLMI
jgi:hypothetical protein